MKSPSFGPESSRIIPHFWSQKVEGLFPGFDPEIQGYSLVLESQKFKDIPRFWSQNIQGFFPSFDPRLQGYFLFLVPEIQGYSPVLEIPTRPRNPRDIPCFWPQKFQEIPKFLDEIPALADPGVPNSGFTFSADFLGGFSWLFSVCFFF